MEASESLQALITRFVLSSCVLFGALLGSGAFLLHQQVAGWFGLILTVVALSLLLQVRLWLVWGWYGLLTFAVILVVIAFVTQLPLRRQPNVSLRQS